jgi:adenylate cyclase
MGTDTIFNYTILGDCVNLASRLEGVNKEYGTLIIVGEDTQARVADGFEFRELDWIRVKGKVNPVAIFELAAERGGIDETRRRAFALYADALALYREGRWTAAAEACARVLAIDPDDGPARAVAARCAHYTAHPPDEWHGVHVMTTK